jgi:hypothetical protein
MGKTRTAYKMKGRYHSEDKVVDKLMLEWILGKYDEKVWTVCIWLRIGTRGGIL